MGQIRYVTFTQIRLDLARSRRSRSVRPVSNLDLGGVVVVVTSITIIIIGVVIVNSGVIIIIISDEK